MENSQRRGAGPHLRVGDQAADCGVEIDSLLPQSCTAGFVGPVRIVCFWVFLAYSAQRGIGYVADRKGMCTRLFRRARVCHRMISPALCACSMTIQPWGEIC